MRILFFLLVYLSALYNGQVLGQQSLYGPLQHIEINYSEKYGIHYLHTIEKGHTLYSLSKLFQVPVSRIVRINEFEKGGKLNIGDQIVIPFDETLLYVGASIRDFDEASFLPVFYTIKPNETLYRVSKLYFGQNVELILQRNDLLGTHLDIEQKLLMGWIPVEHKPAIPIIKAESPEKEHLHVEVENIDTPILESQTDSLTKNLKDSSTVLLQSIDLEITPDSSIVMEEETKYTQTGLAIWNKQGSDKVNLFALHPHARINSLIEIYNPQLQRRTFAKVLGRIPYGMYQNKVDVIVSPKVAQVLGGLNTEFRVVMKYYE